VPNGYPAGQSRGTGSFLLNRLYELSVGYVTSQRVMSLPLGDVGNSQRDTVKQSIHRPIRRVIELEQAQWQRSSALDREVNRPLGQPMGQESTLQQRHILL
jgi:hypothetical protein